MRRGNKSACPRFLTPHSSRPSGKSSRAVAQLGRALRSGRRGRGFESRQPDFPKLAIAPPPEALNGRPERALSGMIGTPSRRSRSETPFRNALVCAIPLRRGRATGPGNGIAGTRAFRDRVAERGEIGIARDARSSSWRRIVVAVICRVGVQSGDGTGA